MDRTLPEHSPDTSEQKKCALSVPPADADARLAFLVLNWRELPESMQEAILEIVKEVGDLA
jgi:hypothetical protein